MTQLSSEELDQLETEVGDDPDFEEAIDAIEDCNGNVQSAIEMIAERAGADTEAVFNYLDEQCRQVICDPDISENLPAIAGTITTCLSVGILSSTGKLAPLAGYAPVIGCLAAIAVKKGIRAYCETSFSESPEVG